MSMRGTMTASVPASRFVEISLCLLIMMGAIACGDGGDNTVTDPSEPEPEVGSVRVIPLPPDHNLHMGDTYRLEAEVETTDGEELPAHDVTWSIDPSGSYSPPFASVSSEGVLKIESPMNFTLEITATADDVSDTTFESISGWGLETGVDEISREPYARANLGANIGAEGPPRLHIQCEGDDLDLHVSVTFVTGSGRVRYRFDGGEEQVENWAESSDFDAVIHPGDPEPLVRRIAEADTMLFAIDKFGAGEVVATFIPKGMNRFLDELVPPCAS